MTDMQTTTTTATVRTGDRLPIFSALHVLGFSYAEVGRLMGVSTMSISDWANGKKRLSIVRHLALLFLVTRLTGVVGAEPPQTRYARRAAIAIDAATRWAALARDELEEDTGGGIYHADQLERGMELGQRMVDRLEAQ